MQSRIRTGLIALVAALVALVLGILWGGHPQALPGFLRDNLVEESLATRAQLIDDVHAQFYKPVSKAELEQGSLKGIVESLDDQFSAYLSPEEAHALTRQLDGKFGGVGMIVNTQDTSKGLHVARVLPDSPAREAGLREGDVITAVDGESIAGEDGTEAVSKVKGEVGTTVKLTYKQGGKGDPKTVEVERKEIEAQLVQAKMYKRGGTKLAAVQLLEFDAPATEQVRKAVEKKLDQGAKGIVLDLRGNPGGELGVGVDVASLFLADGKPVVSTKGRASPERKYEATGDPVAADQPMVVLVNGGSASASEIVTGALRDNKRATVVGEETFGKGVFQSVIPLPNDGILKLTAGSFYLPGGENLAGDGIDPEVEAKDDPKTRKDEALPVALKTLQKQLTK